MQIARAATIDQRIALDRKSRRVPLDQEKTHARLIAFCARNTRRNEDMVRGLDVRHHRLGAGEYPFGPVELGARSDACQIIAARWLLMSDSHHFRAGGDRSEKHTSELQSLICISSAVFCL